MYCSASTLLFFNVRFLFHSLLSPIQTKFPATLLYLPFHLVYLIIHVACVYIYIFNKFTQRSFNLISQPVSPQRIAANSFCKLKEKILFPLFFSLSLFFHPRVAEKLTEKCYDVHGYDETRQGWGRVEKKEEERRKKYCTSLISRLLRNEKYIYIYTYIK